MYVELKCKTNFSFLRGASEASEYIQCASELGIPALAITDINGVYALPRAFEALQKLPQTQTPNTPYSSVKLISGCELTLQNHSPLTLLAKDRAGYGLMCRMITAAHQGKEKGLASLTFPELLSFMNEKGSSSLIALSSVVFPSHSVLFSSPPISSILPTPTTLYSSTSTFTSASASTNSRIKIPGATDWGLLREVFKDRFYLSLSYYLDGFDDERKDLALDLARQYGIRIVASNDVHYHQPHRRDLQDTLTCIREGVTLKTAGFRLFPNEERYLKSPQQMHSLFHNIPDAIQASLDIAELCQFSLSELTYQYPSEWIPPGYTAQGYLEELVWKGAQNRYKGLIPVEVEKQILHEFKLIQERLYADYFLTVYDIVDFAKKNQIYCQGRGSAANSVVCYCLGITVIDPIQMNLLFERFISEDRDEPPDIDVDFEHERREEVIQYIYNKYGRDRAAMISAVRTYQRRSAFLEVSKAVGVAVGTISADELELNFEKYAGECIHHRGTIDRLTEELIDFPRHLSIHSCGFTLSGNPLIETVPIEPARMADRTICQWDKNDLDTLKLIKVDILSLGFLTVIHKTCRLIGKEFWDIPQNEDPQVYEMIQKADTIGTFQIESRAQISTLGVTLPENFYDLVVEVALVRPGPNVGEMKHPYITRRENSKKGIPYVFDDPVIEKILGRTFGVPIFQEQVMKLAIEKAGFSPHEADQLRRAIAGWRSAGAVDTLSERFFKGLKAGGMSDERAKEFFGYMKGFTAYGFPESHAASFATLSYISAWLKFYHPAELLCSLINSQPMGFYSIDVLINDAKRHEVKVLPVDPHLSDWDAKMEAPRTVRMGFRNIHGIQENDFQLLFNERNQRRFEGIQDFLARTHFSKDVIETMAMADVFASFKLDQRHSFWKSIEIRSLLEQKESQQISLFQLNQLSSPHQLVTSMPTSVSLSSSSKTLFKPMTLYEEILEDYRGLGYSLRGNVMKGLRDQYPFLPQANSLTIKTLPHESSVVYAGVIMILQRPPAAKGVAFITLEDEFGSLDLIFFKHIYEKYVDLIRSTRFLIVHGKLDRRSQSLSVLVSSVKAFEPPCI